MSYSFFVCALCMVSRCIRLILLTINFSFGLIVYALPTKEHSHLLYACDGEIHIQFIKSKDVDSKCFLVVVIRRKSIRKH